jgi:methionyl-tRNA formyltransferase
LSKRIVFLGTPEFAAVVLERLYNTGYEIITCITQPDKPVGRHMTLTPPPAKSMAISLGIPVLQPESLRTDDFLATLKELAPNLIITAAYGKILPAAVLSVPSNGSLNVHASLLPKYRGAAPVQWAILNGDIRTGITIMQMDVGMDTGDILSSHECAIGPNETTEELMGRLAEIGADLLVQTITPYIDGEIKPIPQDNCLATLSPPIRKEQGRIDWNGSSSFIHNQIRALTGWPGAYSVYKGARMKIYSSILPENPEELLKTYEEDYEKPLAGTIIRGAKSGIYVACGEGCIILTSIQPQSCRRMQAHECGHNYRTGTRFDEENS